MSMTEAEELREEIVENAREFVAQYENGRVMDIQHARDRLVASVHDYENIIAGLQGE